MVAPEARTSSIEPFELARAGLAFRRAPRERELREPVPASELPERSVGRNDHIAFAVLKTAPILRVESLEISEQRIGVRPVQLVRDVADGPGKPHGIEPDVWIPLVGAEEVEGAAVPSLDGVLEGRLEAAADVDHEARIAHGLDVGRRELDVVRLGAGRSEILDV